MYYQLLDLAGQADSNSSGSWIDRQGRRRAVARSEIELEVLSEWQSQAGQLYPVRWRMDYLPDAKSWVVQAAVQDQLMDLAIRYWEGAVGVYDTQSMRLVGRGYLEMTRSM
jgi:predicted secreted hydrolase